MSSASTTSSIRKRRKAPNPQNSVLDRLALQEALDEAGISLKPLHMDAFYQALHRQHYPPLSQFVETYYKHERQIDYGTKNSTTTNKAEVDDIVPPSSAPLKNAVSNRKNKNRVQLPKAFLDYLQTTTEFVTLTSKIRTQLTSKDRSTTKLVIELYDGQAVESVLMRYNRKGQGRASLCVSSQCGCAMGCTFCATGTMGLLGNLTTAEILEQLIHADSILAKDYVSLLQEQDRNSSNVKKVKNLDLVRNVVFMGQGEPLDNYTNVVNACRAMMDRKRWNLAQGRVTVSTVGLVSQIRKLTKELPEVSLALSLHAPNQKLRTSIVPTAARYKIESLIDALDGHMLAYLKQRDYVTQEERIKESTRRRAMIEYVMLEGETSSLECAHQLGKLCENRHLVVNLIPYNATDVKDKLQCPSKQRMQEFRDIVASYGTFCTIRRTMGADIASACGQLVTKVKSDEDGQQKQQQQGTKREQSKGNGIVDIEDLGGAGKVERAVTPITSSAASRTGEAKSREDVRQIPLQATGEASASSFTDWLENVDTNDLIKWERMLTIASTVTASCFIVCSLLVVRKQQHNR